MQKYPVTPDGRYFVVKERLWRCSNPALSQSDETDLVHRLMDARRAVRDAKTDDAVRAARDDVQKVKVALGERGPVWWKDGAPDLTRYHPKNTCYAQWWDDINQV